VLSALSRTLQGVGDSMAGASPPPELAAHYRLLSSSIALVAGAMAPSFAGDRPSTVRQAIGMFEDATK